MADDLTLMCLGQFVEFPVLGGPSFATDLDAAIRMVDDHPASTGQSLARCVVRSGRERVPCVRDEESIRALSEDQSR